MSEKKEGGGGGWLQDIHDFVLSHKKYKLVD